jgi:hypothetical protein
MISAIIMVIRLAYYKYYTVLALAKNRRSDELTENC